MPVTTALTPRTTMKQVIGSTAFALADCAESVHRSICAEWISAPLVRMDKSGPNGGAEPIGTPPLDCPP